jgi:hypothetical protein
MAVVIRKYGKIRDEGKHGDHKRSSFTGTWKEALVMKSEQNGL